VLWVLIANLRGGKTVLSHRRIAKQQIGLRHLESIDRNARLLAASGGDRDHADRIGAVLDDLGANARLSRPPAEVIRLPRPYDQELEEPPAFRTTGEPAVSPLGAGWLLAAIAGVLVWALIVGVAFGLWELLQ
jgi:hypothetical protein